MPKHELEASPAPESASDASSPASKASSPAAKRARSATPITALQLKTASLPAKIPASAVAREDGCVDTQDGPYTKVLALCMNDFKRSYDSMHERGNSMTILEFIVVRIMRAGFTSSPYEPKTDVPKKQRVFFDEKNTPLQGRPVPTMTLEGANLMCRGYNVHPTPALKNKGRGLVTDIVGTVMPSLFMTFIVHDDTKERTIPGPEVEAGLVPMALVVLDLDMKSSVQCDNGYGLTLRKVNLAGGARMHAHGLWQSPQLYDDRSEFRSQVVSLLQQKKASAVYPTDFAFISKIIALKEDAERSRDSGFVPLATTDIDFEILPSNCHLRATVQDPESQYAKDALLVHVDRNEFTVPHTSAEWLREYYRWCMRARVARLVVVHDEYRRGKGRENGAMSGMRSLVIVNHEAMFAKARARCGELELSRAEAARFAELKGRTLDNTFAGWTVHTDEASGTRFAIVVDHSKERAIKSEHAADEEMDAAESTHFSPVCEVYAGMNPARKLWLAYLCVLPKEAADMQVLEVGICCQEMRASSSMQMPRSVGAQSYMELLC